MEYRTYPNTYFPKQMFKAKTTNQMQVILQPVSSPEGSSVIVETTSGATVASLISSFCTQRGIPFNSSLEIFDEKKRPLPQFSTLLSLGITNGQKLLIGYRDNSFTLKQWPLLVALGALIIGVVGILTISMVYGLTGGKFPDDYGVVMDAGSSKTNTIAYKWQGNKQKGTGCVSQDTTCLAKGGIAEMDPMKLDPVIDCAKNVTKHIDERARPKTPLYFAATAGMRLLKLANETRANEILDHLRNELNETGLSVKAIQIITGEDEGVYGWITANFLEQTLEIPQKTDPWDPTTLGALDMGGASMQIAYALPEYISGTKNIKQMKLYGQTHNVFSHSNLCFGRDEAQRRLRYLLVKDITQTEIEDPCFPRGATYEIKGSDLFRRPCTNSTRFPKIPDDLLKTNYTFKGTSSPNECKTAVANLVNTDLCNKTGFKECFKKLDNIPDNQKYLAFATYYFLTDFLNVTKAPLSEYEKAMQEFCLKDVDEVTNISTSEFALDHCFNAKYIHEVLINGFGFKNTTWGNLQFVKNLQGKDVGWTLGYMIYATNFIPEKAKTPRAISATGLAVSLVLFIFVIIGTLLFILHSHRKGNSNKSLYGQA
ncbi:ectonucleoside triphosphate diphosphohydrolase 8-like isoform X2 [Argiope bruennichi]|uniref:ectonucleoside triphosphate diphosphohydrolase 8-like isoform X2 n=1 Tax=Argiope bruennichi TaxID=94029 RepID=UPI0024940FB7|nr:ectonucleoside triphosphate diphosphohydrolase 8-like isoform X2 [Argiope bruennichi]